MGTRLLRSLCQHSNTAVVSVRWSESSALALKHHYFENWVEVLYHSLCVFNLDWKLVASECRGGVAGRVA